jgi:hypothetical protein
MPQLQEARDLQVFEPRDHHFGVFDAWGSEPNQLALDDRPIHGPKD